MNFPAWPGQSIVQPMFIKKSALPIFPDEPAAAQIYVADFPPCWHGCRCPLVWTNSLFRQALDHKLSRLIVSTCCRFCRFCRLCRFRRLCRFQANATEVDTAAESADTVPRAATAPVSKLAVFLVEPWTIQPVQTHRQHLLPILPTLPISSALPIPTLPAVPEPALFHQRVPSTTFPAWPGQSSIQPMFVQQSALPILPDEPPAAQICAADFPRRWHGCHRPNVRTSSLLRQALDCPVPRSRERCWIASQPPRRRAPRGARGGTNRSDMGLNLSGSWQQGHSTTYNTPSRI